MWKDQPKEEKPFFWIALENAAPRGKPPGHERFKGLTGRLKLEIEVLSEYLYVGSGNIELFQQGNTEQAYYTFARRNGQLVIPGTSIKGAVRSIVEAISNSCVRQKVETKDKKESVPRDFLPCDGAHELCPACRLFGTTGYRGRVHFSDAVSVGDVQTEKTEKVKIADLWPPRVANGRKFYQAKQFQSAANPGPERGYRFVEAVPKGSRFKATLFFENTTQEEMGLLLRAMGLDLSQSDASKVVYAFPIKLGGAKPRCLGAVRMKPIRLYVATDESNPFSTLFTGGEPSPLLEKIKEWLGNESSLDQHSWKRLREEAKQKPEHCPQEMY